MKRRLLDVMCCPVCKGELELWAATDTQEVSAGNLLCSRCRQVYPIEEGIPSFVREEELTGLNRRFARLYDYFSPFYRGVLGLTLLPVGGERHFREETVKGFDAGAGRVLEVSIGPGNNLPYLARLYGIREIVGLDISRGQLRQCQRFAGKTRYAIELVHGMAEALPFVDDSFDAVLHVGGINFFSDRGQAIREMVRVARPGAMIRIIDETERVAHQYDRLPGFSRLFGGMREAVVPPAELVPEEMEGVTVRPAWGGLGYCLEFRKPVGAQDVPVAADTRFEPVS